MGDFFALPNHNPKLDGVTSYLFHSIAVLTVFFFEGEKARERERERAKESGKQANKEGEERKKAALNLIQKWVSVSKSE